MTDCTQAINLKFIVAIFVTNIVTINIISHIFSDDNNSLVSFSVDDVKYMWRFFYAF